MKSGIDPFWRNIHVPSALGRLRQRDCLHVVHVRILSLLGCFDEPFLQHIAQRYADPIKAGALAELKRRTKLENE